MPIEVSCGCGKRAQVPDEMAGKRGKCPACKAVVVIPQPSVTEEETAFALLQDTETTHGEDADAKAPSSPPVPRRGYVPEIPEPIPLAPQDRTATPAPPIKKKKAPEIEYKVRERSGGPPRIVLSPGVVGALGMILLGGVITAIRVDSGRIPIYGVILMMIGGFRLINGLLGNEEE